MSEAREAYNGAREAETELLIGEQKFVQRHEELKVFQFAEEAAMDIFELSKGFPREEMYSLTDQIRRSSRSVAVSIAEAWRRRRYPAAFVNKLSEAESEAGEVQVWIGFALRCGYIETPISEELKSRYNEIIRMLASMQIRSEMWTRGFSKEPKPRAP